MTLASLPIQWPCHRSLSLSLCPTLHPFFVPRKGPSSSIPSFLLLARFSPFFHHGLLSGVLNPFFPVSCHVTAVYESASQTRGERSRARALCKSVCRRVCVRRRVFARVSILSASGPYLDRPADFPRPQPPVTQNHYCYPALWDFRVCFSRSSFSRRKQAEGEVFSGSLYPFQYYYYYYYDESERETDKGRRIRSSLWIYFVLVHSSEAVAASTYRYVSVYRLCSILCVYIYIYFSELAFLLFIRGMARFVSGWQSASDGRAANRWE